MWVQRHKRSIMRAFVVVFCTLVLAACNTAPVIRNESRQSSRPEAPAHEFRKTSEDSVLQFLITAAATDFHTNGPPGPLRFRDVSMGYDMMPNGERRYILCGQFLRVQEGGTSQWTPFATIKTDPYEQWIGAQASTYCQGSSFIWDEAGDVSSLLQNMCESLR
jgi:hypothetical protein